MADDFDPRLRIRTREQWGARKPRSRRLIRGGTAKSWVHHSAAAFPFKPTWKARTFKRHADAHVRQIQAFHIDGRGWDDIAYSFLIFKPYFRRPWVYEGRGWGVVGAHTEGSNSTSHGFCFVGDFTKAKVGVWLVYTLRRLIERGLVQGHLTGQRSSHPTGGHRDAPGAATACPGKNLSERLHGMRQPTRRWAGRRGRR